MYKAGDMDDIVNSDDYHKRNSAPKLTKREKGCPRGKEWVVDGAICVNKNTKETVVRNFGSQKISVPCKIGFESNLDKCVSKTDKTKSYMKSYY